MQLIPLLLLLALFGPQLFREVPGFPRSGNRKLASESGASLSADKRKPSLWKQRGGKQSLDRHLQEQCTPLQEVYSQLLDPMFSLWNQTGFPVQLLENTSGDRVYVRDGKLAMSESTAWGRLIPTFINYIQHIAQLVHLPDMLLPLNPADEPLALVKPGEDARPLLAFCKVPGFSDVLMPNTLEGECCSTTHASLSLMQSLATTPVHCLCNHQAYPHVHASMQAVLALSHTVPCSTACRCMV